MITKTNCWLLADVGNFPQLEFWNKKRRALPTLLQHTDRARFFYKGCNCELINVLAASLSTGLEKK